MERRILVVEDSPTQAERLRFLLEGAGYRVDLATNGREGLENVCAAPPDLVVSDVVMPEMDGYAFCEAVKSDTATRRIPVVLLTVRNTPADLIKGLEAGADNFITKPFEDDYLLERVRRIFEHLALRERGHLDMEVTVRVGQRQIVLSADKQQIIELLLSTSEALDQVNNELVEARRSVEGYARTLEAKVEERTRQLASLHEETERRRRVAETLAEVGRALPRSLDPEEIAKRMVESIRLLLGAQASALFRLDPESGSLVVVALSGSVATLVGPNGIYPPGTGVAAVAVRECRPVATADLLRDPRVSLAPEAQNVAASSADRAVLSVPLLVKDTVIGALSVRDRTGRVFDDEEILLAQAFADQAAVALENARLYQRAQEAYNELARTQAQLVQSQKMEAVGRLAGGIAHDFNNLLTVIAGRTDLLLARLQPQDPLRRDIDLIQESARRAAELVRQLLAFSRKQRLRPKVLDLNLIVSSIGTMLQRLIGEHIDLAIVPGRDLGRVRADRGQIEQVIMNLAVNARDAMPRGGRLIIETANIDLDAAYCRRHAGARPGAYVMLAVGDTGCGMDAETRSHIFEPFFTTKEPGKGTGLGLSTVYGIIKQHDGYIAVESEPGRGTIFSVYLRRVEGPPEAIAPVRARTEALRGSETILLVEDEETLREVAREILEEAGYTVLEASNGDEALSIAERHEGPIHLLVTDVVMPRMGGRELAKRVAALRPVAKVLYMSGYTDNGIVDQGVLDRDIALLEKPFTPESLAWRVRDILG